jgi:hypothetical protein
MSRHCERPGCSKVGEIIYEVDLRRLLVTIDFPDAASPSPANMYGASNDQTATLWLYVFLCGQTEPQVTDFDKCVPRPLKALGSNFNRVLRTQEQMLALAVARYFHPDNFHSQGVEMHTVRAAVLSDYTRDRSLLAPLPPPPQSPQPPPRAASLAGGPAPVFCTPPHASAHPGGEDPLMDWQRSMTESADSFTLLHAALTHDKDVLRHRSVQDLL